MITLDQLGLHRYLADSGQGDRDAQTIARVAAEHKSGYLLFAEDGELEGVLPGKMHYKAQDGGDIPKVGDWVEIKKVDGEAKAVIQKVLPRVSEIARSAVKKDRASDEERTKQVIAANVEVMFIVQGLDHDFNPQRLQRYLLMAQEGGCQPVVVLNKADLVEEPEEKLLELRQVAGGVLVFLASALTGQGIDRLRAFIQPGMTIIFLGSSGVGKSTLVNALLGSETQRTQAVREDDSKGRHTTTAREMILMPGGGILIDTPGMRELSVWAAEPALSATFDDFDALAANCKYRDCDHELSEGCAIQAAVADGTIARERYDSYLKLQRELFHAAAKDNSKEAREKKRQEKWLAKEIKRVVKRKYE